MNTRENPAAKFATNTATNTATITATTSATNTAAHRRPLVVRIRNWVGDVILGLPALHLLQAQGWDLHIVARGKWAPSLLAGYPWPVHVQPTKLGDKIDQLKALRRDLLQLDPGFARRENAILLPVSLSSALEMRLAGMRAVGVAKEGRSPLLARAVPWASSGHELARYWDVACRFLRVQDTPPPSVGFKVAPAAAERADQLLATAGVMSHAQGRFLVICPFAAGRAATADKADKKWPAFAEFTARAGDSLGLPLVVYPGPGEHEEARARYPAATIIDGADLAVYAAVLQRAALVVANDTGPAHLAAALDRPVISVLGPTEAARWAPWGPGVRVLQKASARTAHGDWATAEEGLALARQMLKRPTETVA